MPKLRLASANPKKRKTTKRRRKSVKRNPAAQSAYDAASGALATMFAPLVIRRKKKAKAGNAAPPPMSDSAVKAEIRALERELLRGDITQATFDKEFRRLVFANEDAVLKALEEKGATKISKPKAGPLPTTIKRPSKNPASPTRSASIKRQLLARWQLELVTGKISGVEYDRRVRNLKSTRAERQKRTMPTKRNPAGAARRWLIVGHTAKGDYWWNGESFTQGRQTAKIYASKETARGRMQLLLPQLPKAIRAIALVN